MGIVERIRRLFSEDRTVDTDAERTDAMTAARGIDPLQRGTEGGAIPPNYLPTGMDEGRPKK
jgi:hypothetical protein